MNILVAALAAVLLGIAANATAGALDECQTAQASLRNAEAAAGTRAREIDVATGRPAANAALARTLRVFTEYRTLQCDYVKALYGSGNGAEQAAIACRIDLTRRRVRELQP
jgi:uncharacterized protein YecT (DUF1311 family)